jgi:hypothetical protein
MFDVYLNEMVETWFAHAALPLPQPITQTVPKRSGWQWLSACVTHPASLPGGTKQGFSGFSQPRQCADEVLRIFVTG